MNIFPHTSLHGRFSGGNWLSTLVHGRDGGWELRVKGNLTARNDTGSINSSPISSAPLTVRIQYGCNHTIQIPGNSCFTCKYSEYIASLFFFVVVVVVVFYNYTQKARKRWFSMVKKYSHYIWAILFEEKKNCMQFLVIIWSGQSPACMVAPTFIFGGRKW